MTSHRQPMTMDACLPVNEYPPLTDHEKIIVDTIITKVYDLLEEAAKERREAIIARGFDSYTFVVSDLKLSRILRPYWDRGDGSRDRGNELLDIVCRELNTANAGGKTHIRFSLAIENYSIAVRFYVTIHPLFERRK